jgi:uncharacterized paraquat-inducible protein A
MIETYDNEPTFEESPVACEGCGETYPDSALDSNGRCERCAIKARRRREEYFRDEVNPEIYEL